MAWLKQSTAVTIQIGPFIGTGGVSPNTGLTPVVEISKANAAWVTIGSTGAIAHSSGGWYRRPLNATDTGTLGRFLVKSEGSGYLPVWHEFQIVPANTYDSLMATGDRLDVNAAQYAGVATATGDITTEAEVASAVWGATVARTLTSGGTVADSVWAETTRTLTSGLTVAGSVWVSTTRTLTSGGTSAAAIWTYATRALTNKTGFALTSAQHDTIGTRTWAVAARTLTAFAFTVSAVVTNKTGYTLITGQHDAIGARAWTQTARTLTSGGNVASSVWARGLTDVTGSPAGTAAAAGSKLSFLYVGARYKRITTGTGDTLYSSASVAIARAAITTATAGTGSFTRTKWTSVTG